MDQESLELVRKVWKHSGVKGNVWVPHIYKIGVKGQQKFREGAPILAHQPVFPELRDSVDWYWTPAVTHGHDRIIKVKGDNGESLLQYPNQRAIWVDCDESYDDKLLQSLKPSYMWETSPGHKQAVWLLKEPISPTEFHRDGFIGMLTQALGGDKSGVDIGQLLRFPGTWHHKREAFKGSILRKGGNVYTRGQILQRVARGLGFTPQLASELGAEDPYGDRSKLLWKFARNAAELGLPQDLAFKLINATGWNKWKDEPDRLKEDIGRAYAHQPSTPVVDVEQKQAKDQHDVHDSPEEPESYDAWDMATVAEFGPVLRKPLTWIVPGVIPEGGCGLLVSAPKVGKTRISIEMALGLATGLKPLGLSISKPVPVGFFSLEDGEYLFSSRLDSGINNTALRRPYHWDGHITKELAWHPAREMSLFTNFAQVDLSEAGDKQRLYETIVKYDLKLVIIDTLSMAIGKSDVSNSKDMYAILKDIKTIAKTTGCAIMFIHHTRKRVFEKGESIQEMVLGSTALHAWSDFIMNLVAPGEETDLLRLGVQTKMGNDVHYLDSHLKIIKKPEEEVVADS